MSTFKRTQAKYVKKAYRVRNWPEYEAGLRNRGSLTVWLDIEAASDSIRKWNASTARSRKPGRQQKYSNHAIETSVILGMVFHLPSRQTEGFLRSLFGLLGVKNDVPDHTTISRRKRSLGAANLCSPSTKPVHILIDSSGLRVHVGQMRKPPKNRDYRKLHLAVDAKTGDVLGCDLTNRRRTDAELVPSLLRQVKRPIASAALDTAYDTEATYRAVETHRPNRYPRVLIPPRKGARIRSSGPHERNRNSSQARLGKRKWHKKSGYSRRSRAETGFARYKAIIGPAMHSRNLAAQRAEARIGCRILNRMTGLGMPDSYMVG